MAVAQLIAELRDRIWAHYELAVFDFPRDERGSQGKALPADERPADDRTEKTPFGRPPTGQNPTSRKRPLSCSFQQSTILRHLRAAAIRGSS